MFLPWYKSSRIVDVIDVEVLPAAPQEQPARRVYTLLSVPVDIRLSIEKLQPGRYFGNRSRVVEWLYHDLCIYTMALNKNVQYCEVLATLTTSGRIPACQESSFHNGTRRLQDEPFEEEEEEFYLFTQENKITVTRYTEGGPKAQGCRGTSCSN
ncbi:uncharacterized protein [Dermacentor albipictus]|uniref:uncharacterized protein n=1 Tax=Dermacentor albipictus TaxID=60249 RepID=UPI0038FC1BF3